jgi:aminoglycoside phosphotransferase family enzyme
MKHLLLILTLIFGLTSLPATTFAKDKHDDDWKKTKKHVRGDLDALQTHYVEVEARVKNLGGERRQFEELRGIRANIDDLYSRLDSDRFDYRDMESRIQQGHNDLLSTQNELQYNNQRRGGGGGFYRRD